MVLLSSGGYCRSTISEEQLTTIDKDVASAMAPLSKKSVRAAHAYWVEKMKTRSKPLLRRLQPPVDYDDPVCTRGFFVRQFTPLGRCPLSCWPATQDYTVMFRPQWYNRQRKLPPRERSTRAEGRATRGGRSVCAVRT